MDLKQDKILEDTNKTRENSPLHYLKANETMFILGMYIAWDDNNKDHAQKVNLMGNFYKSRGRSTKQSMENLKCTIPQIMKCPLSSMILD